VGSDLVRRFIKIDLLAKGARPEQHEYRHADLVRHVQSVRAEVITAVLTMQAAWFAAGAPQLGPSLGFGPEFDSLVTWPLAYAGGGDALYVKRDALAQQSPEEQSKAATLLALREWRGDAEWSAAQVVRDIDQDTAPADFASDKINALRDALEAGGGRRRATNVRSLAQYLTALVDQPPREGLALRSRILKGRTLYRVEAG